jgi:SAM-dependent methyltransferase
VEIPRKMLRHYLDATTRVTRAAQTGLHQITNSKSRTRTANSGSTSSDGDPHAGPDGLGYVERTLAGAEYFKHITSVESDRRTRAAFQDLVLRIVRPGAALFDFGAGAGIDARFFAERGFTVEAYDIDPRMRDFFAEYCRDLLETGCITLNSSDYREFVNLGPPLSTRRSDLVICNFAPLNLIGDLQELFARFAALTSPDGRVLASVLNPYFIGDLKLRWWWRSAPRLWRRGHFFMPGPQAPHHRRRVANFAAMSAPHFRLARVFPGVCSNSRLGARLQFLSCRYLFLLFEKTGS